jgi:hypothetical protein
VRLSDFASSINIAQEPEGGQENALFSDRTIDVLAPLQLGFPGIEEQRWLEILQVGVGDLRQIGEELVELWRELVDLCRA